MHQLRTQLSFAMKFLFVSLSLLGSALAGISRPEVSVVLNAGGVEPSIDVIQPSVYWGASDTIGDFDVEASRFVLLILLCFFASSHVCSICCLGRPDGQSGCQIKHNSVQWVGENQTHCVRHSILRSFRRGLGQPEQSGR